MFELFRCFIVVIYQSPKSSVCSLNSNGYVCLYASVCACLAVFRMALVIRCLCVVGSRNGTSRGAGRDSVQVRRLRWMVGTCSTHAAPMWHPLALLARLTFELCIEIYLPSLCIFSLPSIRGWLSVLTSAHKFIQGIVRTCHHDVHMSHEVL